MANIQRYILGPGPITLRQLELMFDDLRKYRKLQIEIPKYGVDPTVSDLLAQLIAEAVKK